MFFIVLFLIFQDIFALLKEALMAAHACVLKNVHWCTTICIAFIVPLASDPNTHAVCTINVGDSYAFLARRLKEDNSQANFQGDVENQEQFLIEVNTPKRTFKQFLLTTIAQRSCYWPSHGF